MRYGGQFFGQTVPRVTKNAYGRVRGMFGPNDNSFWYAANMRGKPSVVINLYEQMVYLFKGGELAGGSPISSGSEGYDTRPGRYTAVSYTHLDVYKRQHRLAAGRRRSASVWSRMQTRVLWM